VQYAATFSEHGQNDTKMVETCFEIMSLCRKGGGVKSVVTPLRCYPFVKSEREQDLNEVPVSRRITVNGLLPREYRVNLFLREKGGEDGTSQHQTLELHESRRFTVVRLSNLPTVAVQSFTQVAIGLNAPSGTVYIPYELQHEQGQEQSSEQYQVCVDIDMIPTGSAEELATIKARGYPEVALASAPEPVRFCLDQVESGVVLSNIQPSAVPYRLSFFVRSLSESAQGQGEEDEEDDGEKTVGYVEVSRLEHKLPTVAVAPDRRVLEWALPDAAAAEAAGKSYANVVAGGSLEYRLVGLPSAKEQVKVCTELLLLRGGSNDFNVYKTYAGDAAASASLSTAAVEDELEAAVTRGVQNEVEEEAKYQEVLRQKIRDNGGKLEEEGEQKESSKEMKKNYPLLFSQCDPAEPGRAFNLALNGLPAGVYVAKVHVVYNVTEQQQQQQQQAVNEAGKAISEDNNSQQEPQILHFPETQVSIVVVVQPPREFIPSYQWRELRGWHRIPLGIESRLPVASVSYDQPTADEVEALGFAFAETGAGGHHDGRDLFDLDELADLGFDSVEESKRRLHKMRGLKDPKDYAPAYVKDPAFFAVPGLRKTARIPNPWQIQLPMPEPCRYFLRTNVYTDMTVGDVLTEAAQQCRGLPAECMNMVEVASDGSSAVVERGLNVKEADIFNKKLRLELLEEGEGQLAAQCSPGE
jgi:hypothetical protein